MFSLRGSSFENFLTLMKHVYRIDFMIRKMALTDPVLS